MGLEALLDAVDPAGGLGVDPSATMVKAAARRLAAHPRRTRAELVRTAASDLPAGIQVDAAIAVNCEQLWKPRREGVEAIGQALRPGGRLATLTHMGAIEKRCSLGDWKALVEADLAACGFSEPAWNESRYRSGPGLGYVTRRLGSPRPRPEGPGG